MLRWMCSDTKSRIIYKMIMWMEEKKTNNRLIWYEYVRTKNAKKGRSSVALLFQCISKLLYMCEPSSLRVFSLRAHCSYIAFWLSTSRARTPLFPLSCMVKSMHIITWFLHLFDRMIFNGILFLPCISYAKDWWRRIGCSNHGRQF